MVSIPGVEPVLLGEIEEQGFLFFDEYFLYFLEKQFFPLKFQNYTLWYSSHILWEVLFFVVLFQKRVFLFVFSWCGKKEGISLKIYSKTDKIQMFDLRNKNVI